jgi:hypothetical protein
MSENYGVFTLERQDLVDLSRRIAQCIPKDFLKNKDKPIVIAVDGSWKCGKKIVADYGGAAALDIEHDDIYFEHNSSAFTQAIAIVSNGKQILCHGKAEYDEYVSADIDGERMEVSFINLAYRSGYSFGRGFYGGRCYESHLEERQVGGIVYIHNVGSANIQPDIEIKLESGSGVTCLGGRPRSCRDVKHALEIAIGKDGVNKFKEWGRFVSVTLNNAALDKGGVMSHMLKNEFGFRAQADIPTSLLEFAELQDDDTQAGQIAIDTAGFPLAKKYASHIQAAGARNELRDEQKAPIIQQKLSECTP